MSEFKPTRFNDEVNMSTESSLKLFFKFSIAVLLLLGATYIIVGYTLESIISKTSIENEQKLWSALRVSKSIKETEEQLIPQLEYAQKLFARIPDSYKDDRYNYRLHIVDDKDPNAFALPGGNIIITSGLFDFLETENGFVFILGHELGHVRNRDHLKGLGFSTAGLFVSALFSGQNSSITNFFASLTNLNDLAHSRGIEEDADETGLEILNAVYGHAGGAEEFFEKLSNASEDSFSEKIPTILSTHPSNQKRIDALLTEIEKQGLEFKPTTAIKKFKE